MIELMERCDFEKQLKPHSLALFWEEKNTPSLNQWYEGKHWAYRKKTKDQWSFRFMSLLSCHHKKCFQTYKLTVQYNSRIDPSNIITVVKMLEDVMKKQKWIIDDSPKYCKQINIVFNSKLNKNCYKAVISGYVFG